MAIITEAKMQNLDTDIQQVGEAINEKKVIVPRYGDPFYSLPLAVQKVMETGGFEPFPTEAQLLASTPTISPKAAKAMDTKKVWYWGKYSESETTDSWHDTGLSELDLAKEFTKENLRNYIDQVGNVSNLFEFNDVTDKTIVVIRGDGDVANDRYSLNSLGEQTESLEEKNKNQLNGSIAISLFDFEDKSGKTIISFADDGNISTPRGNIYDALDDVSGIKTKTDKINETLSQTLHEFTDIKGNTTHALMSDGDILFGGGKSLFSELESASNSGGLQTVKETVSTKEYLTNDFINLIVQGIALNGATARVNTYSGIVKQKYSILSDAEFLNLKIKEPANPIPVETPYYQGNSLVSPASQVVHPYLCDFKETIHGFKYLLILNPFHRTFDVYENPVVYGSNTLNAFKMLEGFDQPLAHASRNYFHDYNSDSFAAFDHTTGEFCVFYRHTIHPESNNYAYSNLYVRRTTDFINWTLAKKLVKTNGDDKFDPVSPSIIFNPKLNKWMMYGISFNAISQRQELGYQISDNIESGWSNINFVNYENSVDHIIFWHQEVRYCGDKFICVVNDVLSDSNAINGKGNLYLGISSDGINWKFSQNSIFDGVFHNPYKATISPFIQNNLLRFNIVWTSNGNDFDGWKLYSSQTNAISISEVN